MRCSTCRQKLTQIGKFWICPEHGHVDNPIGTGGQPLTRFAERRIFLSYGHDESQSLAVRLKDDLLARGHEVWFDRERLKLGEDWEQCLERGLEWAAEPGKDGCILLLMTPHAVRRPDGYCLNELAAALAKNVPPIPVMVAQVEPPLSIARLQWLDMTECVPLEHAGPRYEDRCARLINAIESGKLDCEGSHARLLGRLRPIDFHAEKMWHLREFTGRTWVLAEIQKWLANPNASRVFWLTGAPGVGKTALSVWLATRTLPAIKAWHLCQHNHQVNKDPRRCVMSLAYYLAALIPDYFEQLARVELERDSGKDAWTLFDLLLVQPLAGLDHPKDPVVILIDALDEATQADGSNLLAEFIGQQFKRTPNWLRLIVTSRPVAEVDRWLTSFEPWILSTSDSRNEMDIDVYVRHRLESHATTAESLSAAATVIAQHSGGVFLYAEYVCNEIISGRIDVTRPETFPTGLGAVYAGFFQRRFADRDEYGSLFASVFEMVAGAYEPLRVDELSAYFEWSQRRERRFRDCLGALFRIDDGRIEPFHKSLMDWLTGNDSAAYYVGPEDGRKRLADWGWETYERDGPGAMSKYFLKHLPQHLIDVRRWDQVESVLTDLRYVEARCQAGQTFDLVRDYESALDALPERQQEHNHHRERLEALRRYGQQLAEYSRAARSDSSLPLVKSPNSWIKQESIRHRAESTGSKADERGERIQHYANFLSTHSFQLQTYPEQIIQQARNYAAAGPIVEQAEQLLVNGRTPWLARDPRPQAPPADTACLRILEGHTRRSTLLLSQQMVLWHCQGVTIIYCEFGMSEPDDVSVHWTGTRIELLR